MKLCESKGAIRRSRYVVAGCSAELQGSVEAIGKKVWKKMKSEELQLIHAVAENINGN